MGLGVNADFASPLFSFLVELLGECDRLKRFFRAAFSGKNSHSEGEYAAMCPIIFAFSSLLLFDSSTVEIAILTCIVVLCNLIFSDSVVLCMVLFLDILEELSASTLLSLTVPTCEKKTFVFSSRNRKSILIQGGTTWERIVQQDMND